MTPSGHDFRVAADLITLASCLKSWGAFLTLNETVLKGPADWSPAVPPHPTFLAGDTLVHPLSPSSVPHPRAAFPQAGLGQSSPGGHWLCSEHSAGALCEGRPSRLRGPSCSFSSWHGAWPVRELNLYRRREEHSRKGMDSHTRQCVPSRRGHWGVTRWRGGRGRDSVGSSRWLASSRLQPRLMASCVWCPALR